jgi:hypothetical protein
LDTAFYYELAAYKTSSNGVLTVDDFMLAPNPASSAAAKPNIAAEAAPLPTTFALQNYPNPFNAATRIRLELPQAAEVEMKIFDMAGREVDNLASGPRSAGSHEVIWKGRNRDGSELSSGIYLVRLRYRTGQAGVWSQLVRRVMMVK